MKRRFLIHSCLLVALLLSLHGYAASQTGTYIKDGKEYGVVRGAFRNRWWNYYERGLSFMEGEFYNEALSDFNQAIKQRSDDQRMARTYGMHFIDYFPHREAGLVQYLMGDYDAAKREIELSQKQEPSAKAQYYIDKIRKAIMEREGQAISIPSILVDLPEEIWTRDDPVIISGVAEDKQYISEIILAGKSVFLEAANQRIGFKKGLSLEQGRHVIDITARNLLGGEAGRKVIIHVDRLGPVLTMEPISADSRDRNIIKGFLYDESGKISLSIEGVELPVPEGEDVPFEAAVKPGAKSIKIQAKDRLGNETRAEIDLENTAAQKIYPLLALNGIGNIISDIGGYRLALSFGKQDTQGPAIELSGWYDDQTVFIDKAYIEGKIRDESDIVGLTVNGKSLLRREGKIIFFNHLVALKKGKNIISIKAKDEEGNEGEKSITITRLVPKVLQLGARFSMTLIPFEDKGLTSGLSDRYDNLLLTELVNQERFRLIEREKLDRIIEELKLSPTQLVDQNTALKVGRLVAAQTTLVGSFIETKAGIEIVTRLIDNETSELLAAKDVYGESKERDSLKLLAEGMSVKYLQEFPLVDGIVVQGKGDYFFTDLGEGEIKPQRRLIIYREGEAIRDPDTGEILSSDTDIIGYARVTQVLEKISRAEPIQGLKAKDIRVKDKVMTQ